LTYPSFSPKTPYFDTPFPFTPVDQICSFFLSFSLISFNFFQNPSFHHLSFIIININQQPSSNTHQIASFSYPFIIIQLPLYLYLKTVTNAPLQTVTNAPILWCVHCVHTPTPPILHLNK
jgi:hypothetical protein